ncbi:mannose-1-phosphate guanylyltransferase [Bacteriovorax sp. DB6_IX]|uniref:mannose-1-phosphate guanylyltransferase n=1 Tax=Bacteriovorax sp. DB6_IX TaxID=1353530 RepID=UPI00038A5442|nr:sugar phosphate nucleotidyltransferase [Bacteriovorax sp. DB6_IX]EQC52375.1 mannose-1-phosphate guanylyltransferase 1 family protein [Bacteriovorax sp. DB6_IX]
MSEFNTYCLIMAGGKGTRLWPESTQNKPKQYLSLVGDGTLLSQTLKRFENIVDQDHRYIVTTFDQRDLAKECSENLINQTSFIYEPSGRNTGPCILLSLAAMEKAGATDNDVVAVMPSDHVILDLNGFQSTFNKAVELARSTDSITTMGIRPHFPHTGYGYIRRGDKVLDGFKVAQFVEKPNFETAKSYLATGEYFWNAGMFMATLGTFKREFAKHSPQMFAFYEELKNNADDFNKLSEVYNKVPEDSIDYAIMEKSENVTIVPAEFDWNDLGSWEALEQVIDPEGGNTVVNAKSVYLKDAEGNVIYAPGKFVSLININDLVVVSNDKTLMVMPKKDAQRVKEVVNHLKDKGEKELL